MVRMGLLGTIAAGPREQAYQDTPAWEGPIIATNGPFRGSRDSRSEPGQSRRPEMAGQWGEPVEVQTGPRFDPRPIADVWSAAPCERDKCFPGDIGIESLLPGSKTRLDHDQTVGGRDAGHFRLA